MGSKAQTEDFINQSKKQVERFMDDYPNLCQTARLKRLEKRHKYSRAYLFLAFNLILGVALYLMGGVELISSLIGFGYPAYASFKAIDSPSTADDTQWLTYWSIFAVFSLIEDLLQFLVRWVPFYHWLKLVFLVWAYSDRTKGASLIYQQALQPLVQKHLLGKGGPASSGAVRGRDATNDPRKRSGAGAGLQKGSSFSDKSYKLERPGELHVNVVSASNLAQVKDGGKKKADPFCVLEVLPIGDRAKVGIEKTKYKTACKLETLDPKWNELVVLKPIEQLDANLHVSVFSKEAMGQDIFVGKTVVPLRDLSNNKEKKLVYDLEDPDKKATCNVSGDLTLSLQLK